MTGEEAALLREGLALLLQDAGFAVVAATGNGTDLVRLARTERPALVLAMPTGAQHGSAAPRLPAVRRPRPVRHEDDHRRMPAVVRDLTV